MKQILSGGKRDDLRQSKIDLPGTSTSSRIGSRLKEIGKTTISGCLKQLPTWCKPYLKKLGLVFFLLSVFSSKFFFLGFFLDLVPNGAQTPAKKLHGCENHRLKTSMQMHC